jgi:hypothetical protein
MSLEKCYIRDGKRKINGSVTGRSPNESRMSLEHGSALYKPKSSRFGPPSSVLRVGVQNWTDSLREKLHSMGMNHDRIQTIATEMCGLLNEQTEWLKSPTILSAQSREEVDGYARRNDRLRQLGEELSEVD